jgi:hypothetical protein
MAPNKFAKLLIAIAQSNPVYDTPGAIDEVIYLVAWCVWDITGGEAAEWTQAVGRALDRLRPGITSEGCHERFSAYSDAKNDDSGGGPMWHITRVFQSYALGAAPLDLMQTMEVSARVAALMKGVQDALLADA